MAINLELPLFPGLLCDDEPWRDVVDGVSGIATCHVADLTSGETLGDLANSVLSVAPPQFALVGFSFGGYVAQQALRRAPNRVEWVALHDTSGRPDTRERRTARLAIAATAETVWPIRGHRRKANARFHSSRPA